MSAKKTAAQAPRAGLAASATNEAMTRARLIALLNEDLAREYQAIVAYVIYSQAIKGAAYMAIAQELEVHAGEELQHATRHRQADRLPGRHADEPGAARAHFR